MGAAIRATPGTVEPAGTPLAGAGAPPLSALVALPFAILGGLLLNIMPCVFPILGLKAMSLARAGETEREARAEALAYTGGVMLTCLALGGAILGLRAAGESVGWAFQLQDPRVIVALLLLVTAIALNLAGLFDIGAPRVGGEALAAQGGSAGAFWTGALAAVVATPCTGPFMGIALGAAILLPAATGLVIFAGLGLGLALPFLAIGFVPALRRRLPKPGPWLATFRRLMAVPMFATALALAWVLGRQSGTAGMTYGVAAALLLGVALWWLGVRQRGDRGIAAPLAIAIAALGAIVALPKHEQGTARVADIAVLPATEAFSEARLAELRSSGTPVFVYFTADWCITCKVNEKGALSSPEVAKAFADAGVVTLVGDWTSADPAITRFLERHGRAGVPLYLFYGAGEPVTLPQLLDVGTLLTLARDAAR
jgi:thiol:disulfide interchange protein